MPESKLRRIAALALLVLAVVMLAFAGGASASAGGPKAAKGAKSTASAKGKAAKVGTRARLYDAGPPTDPGDDGRGWVDPPGDIHFGW